GAAAGFGADTGADNDSVAAFVKPKLTAFMLDGSSSPVPHERMKLAFERGDDGDFGAQAAVGTSTTRVRFLRHSSVFPITDRRPEPSRTLLELSGFASGSIHSGSPRTIPPHAAVPHPPAPPSSPIHVRLWRMR